MDSRESGNRTWSQTMAGSPPPQCMTDTQILEAQDVFDLVTLKRVQLESGHFTARSEKAPVLPCVPSA